MQKKVEELLKRKQKIAEEINRLIYLQRQLTTEIKQIEKDERKAELINKGP